ncbi:MAG TPA: hypothetical protein VNG29_02660 [Candidatus Paceibacterota bacterium]|nr:hypothetical protein [Candidatus Paceibacterota bacterium]
MKAISTAMLLLCACSLCFAGRKKNESPLELRNIYLQTDVNRPDFLPTATATAPEQFARLGESLRFWVAIQLRKGEQSPCPFRNEEPCHLEFAVVAKNANRAKVNYLDHETRLNQKIDFELGYPITRDSSLGEKILLFRVRFKDQILCSFEASVKVTE